MTWAQDICSTTTACPSTQLLRDGPRTPPAAVRRRVNLEICVLQQVDPAVLEVRQEPVQHLTRGTSRHATPTPHLIAASVARPTPAQLAPRDPQPGCHGNPSNRQGAAHYPRVPPPAPSRLEPSATHCKLQSPQNPAGSSSPVSTGAAPISPWPTQYLLLLLLPG